MIVGNTLKDVLVNRIATQGELRVGCKFIPCRYNGEDIPHDASDSVSGDHRFFGPVGNAEYGWDQNRLDAWPVKRHETSTGVFECVVPDFPVNVAILAAFKERPEYARKETASGHTNAPTGKMLPPLYVRLDMDDGQDAEVSAMSDATLQSLTEQLLRELQKRAPQPAGTQAPAPASEPEPINIVGLSTDAATTKISGAIDSANSEMVAMPKLNALKKPERMVQEARVDFLMKSISLWESQFEAIAAADAPLTPA